MKLRLKVILLVVFMLVVWPFAVIGLAKGLGLGAVSGSLLSLVLVVGMMAYITIKILDWVD